MTKKSVKIRAIHIEEQIKRDIYTNTDVQIRNIIVHVQVWTTFLSNTNLKEKKNSRIMRDRNNSEILI